MNKIPGKMLPNNSLGVGVVMCFRLFLPQVYSKLALSSGHTKEFGLLKGSSPHPNCLLSFVLGLHAKIIFDF